MARSRHITGQLTRGAQQEGEHHPWDLHRSMGGDGTLVEFGNGKAS